VFGDGDSVCIGGGKGLGMVSVCVGGGKVSGARGKGFCVRR